jgi:hypothetical protein
MIDETFWARVDQSGECWLWQGSRNAKGYGTLQRHAVQPTPMLAHRYAWMLAVGSIPDGLNVLHTCDTPACVRPAHLFLGTLADNNADMRAKGRASAPPMRWHGLCKRGHPLTAANRAPASNGRTYCRTCKRASQRQPGATLRKPLAYLTQPASL